MTRVVLVTCNRWPEISASDRLYAEALAARGLEVQGAPWNGPFEPFDAADVIVLRSCWDYHHERAAFVAWNEELERRGKKMFNQAELVLWNLDKSYLLELAGKGARVPRMRLVPNNRAAIARIYDELSWDQAVIKPAVGASGHEVQLVGRDALQAGAGAWTARSPVIVQEFVHELRQTGEMSCVFFDGEFSHGLLKRPGPGEFRINSTYGGVVEPAEAPAAIVRQARAVLDLLDEMPLYARVDGVLRDGALLLMELELIEPGLCLDLDPLAAARFAEATVGRLQCRNAT